MAVPKKRISSSRRGARRAHNAIKAPSLSVCANCQEPMLPHRVCPKCGWYRGREVVSATDE
ncbi:MAG: 50S ribosomal protein L32 [Magnetococcales bacterium]|nr:50S ribosomal protein L32 [Magnetococcales bacterium]